MIIQPKTTYRGENDSGQLEIRKSFAVERSDLKVWKEENDKGTEVTHIEVPVSSTSEDRDGDEFSDRGVENQAAQFRSGTVGMWLDHGLSPETMFPDYRVLEQIGGWKDARIDDDEEQLFATAALRPSSEEAQELETMLDEGVAPVAFSVGFIVEKSEEKEDSESGQIFHEVDLLECSAVGIPSNPDAMVSDSAMATAKAVADAGGYDGEPENLARAITSEMRSLPYVRSNQQRDKSMKYRELKQEGFEEVASAISDYLDADETSSDDAVPELVNWVSEEMGEEIASLVTEAADAALDSTDAESIDEMTVSDLNGYVEETLESDEDEEGEEDEEEESGEPGDGKSGENDPPELRSAVRDALKETLPEALTSEEALRSLISEEVRDALAEEEFEVEVTDSFVEELRSELFKDGGEGQKRPTPAGTISTYEPEEENSGDGEGSGESGDGGKNNGGSGNASKPSPAIGGN